MLPRCAANLLAVLALLVTAPASARTDIGRPAGCLVRADAERSRTFAVSVPASQAERHALADLQPALKRCSLTTVPSRDVLLLGGAIAEILLKREYRGVTSHRFTGFDPQQMDALGVSERALLGSKGWPSDLAILVCAATRDPRSSAAILRSRSGSKDEAELMERIKPAAERCVDNGQNFSFDRSTLRAVLARHTLQMGPMPASTLPRVR